MVRVTRGTLAKFDNVELIETMFETWRADKALFRLINLAASSTYAIAGSHKTTTRPMRTRMSA
jgi:hypothetical protein